jgi:hypothetical protein
MNKLALQVNAPFESVSYDENADSWVFIFGDNILMQVSGFWRMLQSNKIALVSLDHGHQFGLPKALNLVHELTNSLKGEKLSEIRDDDDTGDLTLHLTNNYEIQVFIASSAYETYSFSIGNKRYIGPRDCVI